MLNQKVVWSPFSSDVLEIKKHYILSLQSLASHFFSFLSSFLPSYCLLLSLGSDLLCSFLLLYLNKEAFLWFLFMGWCDSELKFVLDGLLNFQLIYTISEFIKLCKFPSVRLAMFPVQFWFQENPDRWFFNRVRVKHHAFNWYVCETTVHTCLFRLYFSKLFCLLICQYLPCNPPLMPLVFYIAMGV